LDLGVVGSTVKGVGAGIALVTMRFLVGCAKVLHAIRAQQGVLADVLGFACYTSLTLATIGTGEGFAGFGTTLHTGGEVLGESRVCHDAILA
jgi:hypothetical protein